MATHPHPSHPSDTDRELDDLAHAAELAAADADRADRLNAIADTLTDEAGR